MDLVITPANVISYTGARTAIGTAGEAIAAGQTMYILAATGRLWKADASTAVKATCVGIALNGGAAGQPIVYLTMGGINPGAPVAIGTIYGVTDTPGGISAIVDRGLADFITILGVATTTSRIEVRLNISGVAIP